MNRQRIKNLLPFIKNLIKGKELEYLDQMGFWQPLSSLKDLQDKFVYQLRYKPQPIILYIGVFKGNHILVYSSSSYPKDGFNKTIERVEKDKTFIKWLDKKEYILENNDD
jgi:hypothetical protein